MRIAVVTATDHQTFYLAKGLLLSLVEVAGDYVARCVIDIGCTARERAWLAGIATALATPDPADEPIAAWPEFDRHHLALRLRSRLPHVFPGYDAYFWLDADTWVQTAEPLELLGAAVRLDRVGAIPELHRSYQLHYGYAPEYEAMRRDWWGLVADGAELDRLTPRAVFNVGVFSAAAQSPFWERFEAAMQRLMARTRLKHFFDQMAFNQVLAEADGLVEPLPAYCNWLCGWTQPVRGDQSGLLVEPSLPYHPLGILHLIVAPNRVTYLQAGLFYRRGRYIEADDLPDEKRHWFAEIPTDG